MNPDTSIRNGNRIGEISDVLLERCAVKKKIVHVTEAFGGGVYSFLAELCNRSVQAGYAVLVIYSKRDESPLKFKDHFHPAVRFIRIKMCRAVRPIEDFVSLIRLMKVFRSIRPDIIHLHSSKAGAIGRVAARVVTPRANVFYSPHGLACLQSNLSTFARRFYSIFERIADCFGGTVVACSCGELEELRRRVRPRNVRLIENGVDTNQVPRRRTRGDGKIVIGMMGRASFQKNHELFLDLANQLKDSAVEFIWIGGEQAHAQSQGADSDVRCTGWILRGAALDVMSGLDIYVQTSRWEGMPLALIEAQVAGIPAVVTDVVGNRDVVVHGKTGFVAGSKEALRDYVELLLRDGSLRNEVGLAATRVAVQRFCLDSKFRQWISLYDETIWSAGVMDAADSASLETDLSQRRIRTV